MQDTPQQHRFGEICQSFLQKAYEAKPDLESLPPQLLAHAMRLSLQSDAAPDDFLTGLDEQSEAFLREAQVSSMTLCFCPAQVMQTLMFLGLPVTTEGLPISVEMPMQVLQINDEDVAGSWQEQNFGEAVLRMSVARERQVGLTGNTYQQVNMFTVHGDGWALMLDADVFLDYLQHLIDQEDTGDTPKNQGDADEIA